MSRNSKGEPANPLDKFNSYSYHHILYAADSTEGIAAIQDGTPPLESQIDQPIGGSNAYVVIDTRRNSHFSVKDITYATSSTGQVSPTASGVMTSVMTMKIHDPNGITFQNYLQFLVDDALSCDYTGMSWLLQTLFVGHSSDGTSSIVTTSALPLMLMNMDVEFDSSGGTYQLTFAGLAGAPVGLEQRAAEIGNTAANIKSGKNQTLKSLILNFQDALNTDLKDYWNKLNPTNLPATGSGGMTTQRGRMVQYMFTIPDSWDNFTVDGHAEKHVETDFRKKTEQPLANNAAAKSQAPSEKNTSIGTISVNLAPTMHIDEALAEILKHCDQIHLNAGSRKRIDQEGNILLWKTVSSITSDSKTIVLHWDIVEFTVPNINIKKSETVDSVLFQKWFDKGDDGEWRPKNSLEFDYYFSGRNADILNFEMKMQHINLLLLDRFNADMFKKQVAGQKNDEAGEGMAKKEGPTFIRRGTPIFLPPKTGDQLKGFSYITPGSSQTSKARQDWTSSLAAAMMSSSIDCKMTIRGNPDIMISMTQPIMPHPKGSIESSSYESSTAQYRKALNNYVKKIQTGVSGTELLPMSAYPLFTKVNVFGPDVDFNGDPVSENFAKQIWYDKYYMVRSITHFFDSDGSFRQELTMGAMAVFEEPANREAKSK